MALNTAALAADLKAIYEEMDEHPTTNQWLADQIAAAIDKQIKTATVTGTATGALAGGPGVPITGSLV
jgi:hypothetical protein